MSPLVIVVTSVSARKWSPSWTNENILFTKSEITSECHDIFWWNKKYYFNEWLGQTISLSILIFWQWLWPNFYPKWSKFAQNWSKNVLFPHFSELSLVLFAKTFLKTVQTFIMSHSLKLFFVGWGSQGVQEQPDIAFLSRFTPICWHIFRKLPLNSILITIRVPLKLFFKKNCFGLSNRPENGPKLAQNVLFPYFSELFLVFLLKNSSKQYRVSQLVRV